MFRFHFFEELVVKYTTLGRTGVTVSRICLGCMSYGDPAWRPWVLDEAAAKLLGGQSAKNDMLAEREPEAQQQPRPPKAQKPWFRQGRR